MEKNTAPLSMTMKNHTPMRIMKSPQNVTTVISFRLAKKNVFYLDKLFKIVQLLSIQTQKNQFVPPASRGISLAKENVLRAETFLPQHALQTLKIKLANKNMCLMPP